VQVVFDQNADIEKARQAVAERLQPIRGELPANGSAPEISPLVSPLGTILQFAFTLKGTGPTTELELRRLVQSSFENQLLEIPGVAQVTVYGGDELQQQIWVDPNKLRSRAVSLQAVADAAAEASATARRWQRAKRRRPRCSRRDRWERRAAEALGSRHHSPRGIPAPR
jgi:nickel/cobalt tolerance cation efflux system protein